MHPGPDDGHNRALAPTKRNTGHAPLVVQALANQRITKMRAATVSRHRRPPSPQKQPSPQSGSRPAGRSSRLASGSPSAAPRPDPTAAITQTKPLQMGGLPEAIRPRRRRAEQPSWSGIAHPSPAKTSLGDSGMRKAGADRRLPAPRSAPSACLIGGAIMPNEPRITAVRMFAPQ
jgi:hypothetical protein